jgi:hypothetical protein
VVLTDLTSKRVVNFEIVRLTKAIQGNYEGSGNGMDIVIGCVHDCDAKASKVLRQLEWDITEFFDPNHLPMPMTGDGKNVLCGLPGSSKCGSLA